MKMKKIPQRTCIGCGQVKDKKKSSPDRHIFGRKRVNIWKMIQENRRRAAYA